MFRYMLFPTSSGKRSPVIQATCSLTAATTNDMNSGQNHVSTYSAEGVNSVQASRQMDVTRGPFVRDPVGTAQDFNCCFGYHAKLPTICEPGPDCTPQGVLGLESKNHRNSNDFSSVFVQRHMAKAHQHAHELGVLHRHDKPFCCRQRM